MLLIARCVFIIKEIITDIKFPRNKCNFFIIYQTNIFKEKKYFNIRPAYDTMLGCKFTEEDFCSFYSNQTF